jgi:hypothetical protein
MGVAVRAPALSQSSLSQELLTQSAKRELSALDLAAFSGMKTHLAVVPSTSTEAALDAAYVEQLLSNELLRRGAILVADRAQADVIVICTVHIAGLDLASRTFPPGWLFAILPIKYQQRLTATALFELCSYNIGEPATLARQAPTPRETSYTESYFFGLGPFRGTR